MTKKEQFFLQPKFLFNKFNDRREQFKPNNSNVFVVDMFNYIKRQLATKLPISF